MVTGSLVRMAFGNRRARGLVVGLSEQREGRAGDELVPISGVVGPGPIAPEPLPRLLQWIAHRYCATLPAVVERIVPSRVRVAAAETKRRASAGSGRLDGYRGSRQLLEAIASGAGGSFVLRVLPDEDRRAVVTELVSAATTGTVLVAVPEVRFGSAVLEAARALGAVRLDSAVEDGVRSAAWFGLAAGSADIGAGGRSAVLAPASDLRLIVVDEEHDSAYKEDRAPRYDARRVALHRAREAGAVCVLISPTPSLEAGNAVLAGSFGSVQPERNEERSRRPLVEVVARPEGRALSPALHSRVQETLRLGRSIALLAPVGGYARTLWCAACRRSVRCERCESGMALHRSAHSVRCPHCGSEAPAPSSCPACGAGDLTRLGAGSERLAEQAAAAFPRGTVVRMDPDVLAESGPVPPEPGKPLVYVTTWIGTKEAIRPEVALVGVLDADALIRRPQWNAAEIAYRALAEMAAWAGPASAGGRLVIQTSEAGHHAVQAVARADYRFFLERELEARRELGYPPFSELIRIAATGVDAAEWIRRAAEAAARSGGRVLGPVETDVRSARDTRPERGLELLVKAPSAEPVSEALRVILPDVPKGTRLRVDVDPR